MPEQRACLPPSFRLRAVAGLILLIWLVGPSLPAGASELRRTPVVRAVQIARPAVVNIRGEKTIVATTASARPEECSRRVNGMGTGVVIDPRGYILTNHHVVDGVRDIQVTLADGQSLSARLVAHDIKTDLAIIKVDSSEDLPLITIGTSSDLMPGETVIAVGNAYGYEHTVTRGIISALHRSVQVSDAQYYDDLIQTDASINPGNSGGPLLNIDGEMVGVNVAVRAGAQGIGFAIPIDEALRVAARILAACEENRAWHGLTVDADTASDGEGVAIAAVEPDSPAAAAELAPGDRITKVADLEIRRAVDFHRALLGRTAGDAVAIVAQRDGEEVTAEVTLAQLAKRSRTPGDAVWQVLGMRLQPVPAGEFQRRYQSRYRGGLAVTGVRGDSPAADQGIQAGDVLVGMHIWETVSLENVSYILNRPDFNSLAPVKFYILRKDQTLYGYLPLTTATATARR